MGLARLLGLRPAPEGRIGEAVAQAAARAHLHTDGTASLPEAPGMLTWDAAGRAVWRFQWAGPIPGAPGLVVDVDAASGAVMRAGPPPR